eukprot:GILK01009198.1.p1 GENE.GILK01009198.1~~GILK01009198.1.p1  ORF type:complete len:390 (-),score=53.12 GILK01009198.1:54-1076(-)
MTANWDDSHPMILRLKEENKKNPLYAKPHPSGQRALDVGIIGAPNAGKSTLMNILVGSSVSAVSPKVNTTRREMLGVMTRGSSQIVFHDTPGIIPSHESKQFSRDLSVTAWSTLGSVDVALLIVDAVKKIDDRIKDAARRVTEQMKENRERQALTLKQTSASSSEAEQPRLYSSILVLNKVDLVHPKDRLLELSHTLNEAVQGEFQDTFMIAAAQEDGVSDLEEYLKEMALPRPWEYPANTKTDLDTEDLIAEIIREKCFQRLHKEIPYRIRQRTRQLIRLDSGFTNIDQLIYVDTDSQKQVMFTALREITQKAEASLAEALNCGVALRISIKAKKDSDP